MQRMKETQNWKDDLNEKDRNRLDFSSRAFEKLEDKYVKKTL